MDPQPPPLRQLPSEREITSSSSSGSSRRRSAISTRQILQNFCKPVRSDEGRKEQEQWEHNRAAASEALERLTQATEPSTAFSALKNLFAPPPTSGSGSLQEDWKTATEFYAPSRSKVPIYVTDFREETASHEVHTLGLIEKYFVGKPRDVKVRWIHCPIGRGLLQSTIEDLFNYTGSKSMGKPFRDTGNDSWPYPEITMASFFSRAQLQEQIDSVKKLARMDCPDDKEFTIDPLGGFTERQQKDLRWRAGELKCGIDFWRMTSADFPFVLEQTFLGHESPLDLRSTLASRGEFQVLSRHRQFEGAILMINELRAFHRDDGYVLTFSNQSGIDHLGENFRECLARPPHAVFRDPEASVFGHAFDAFLDSGVSTWGRKTVEWLIVWLFTEVAVTPHNIRHGRNAISYLQGFADIAKQLKEQQKRPWVRGERFKLVSQYVECVHTLKALQTITLDKTAVISSLRKDCARFEQEYTDERVEKNTTPVAESLTDRLDWAQGLLQEQEADLKRLISHFQDSLKILFQQQTIELNELAVAADSQNTAILVFTGVTVVFLPLSFFTSYFGMNLEGLASTERDEFFFWKVCGTFTIVLLGVMFVSAFKKHIREYIRRSNASRLDLFKFKLTRNSDVGHDVEEGLHAGEK